MNQYITFRDKDDDGVLQYYILQRDFPHYIGLISDYPKQGALTQQAIAGYKLWVVFTGTLRGNMIPSYKDILEEIKEVYFNMAQWFYAERILIEPARYKKFKI